jgi:dienelactone hydrolase
MVKQEATEARDQPRAGFVVTVAEKAQPERWIAFLTLLLLFGGCSAPFRNPIMGRWEGAMRHPEGAELHTIIDFMANMNGLRAQASIPEMFMFGTELAEVRLDSPRIHFELQDGRKRLIFDGTQSGDAISGSLRDGELQLQLDLRRRGDIPPLPYKQEEVSIRNGAVSLAGTLLVPPTEGPHPGVVLIHDAGRQTRDKLQFFADLFVRRGIAALVYDKRDINTHPSNTDLIDLGGPAGDVSVQVISVHDLAGDALAAVQYLKEREDMDSKRIGLWGIGQGGWVAPIVAAQSKDVAFMVVISAPGVTSTELGKYAETKRLSVDATTDNGTKVAPGRSSGEASPADPAASATLPAIGAEALNLAAWAQSHDHDPVTSWERVTVPVLAIYGSGDAIIPFEPSAKRIDEALKRNGNQDLTIKVFSGANHEIRVSGDPRAGSGGTWDFPRPATGYLETMTEWLLQKVRMKS